MFLVSFASASVGYNMYGGDVIDSYKINKLDNDSYKVVGDFGVKYVKNYYFDYLGRPVYVIDEYDSTQGVPHRVKLVKGNDDEDDYGFRKRSAAENYWKGKYYEEKRDNVKKYSSQKSVQKDDSTQGVPHRAELIKGNDVPDKFAVVGGSSYYTYYSNVFRKYIKVKCYDSPPKGKIFYKKCP